MPTQVLMPPLSQTLETLVLVEWLKQSGQPVTKGEPLFLVESDKATLEVEAPASGVVSVLSVEPGTEVRRQNTDCLDRAAWTKPSPGSSFGRRFAKPTGVGTVASGTPAAGGGQPARPCPGAGSRASTWPALHPNRPCGMIVARDVAAALAQQTARISPVARRTAAAEGINVRQPGQSPSWPTDSTCRRAVRGRGCPQRESPRRCGAAAQPAAADDR
jgi:pyruvate/2-oxoglutarate dehydrogenase complex dihydrolipoamide acyltransferase (E2) component